MTDYKGTLGDLIHDFTAKGDKLEAGCKAKQV